MTEASEQAVTGMNVLVTGATGFLGSHLVKALRNEGYRVTILKRSFSDCSRISHVLPDLEVYDIDRDGWEAAFVRHGTIDAIIHTATLYGHHGESLYEMMDTNLSFPMRLLEIGAAHNTSLFINTDSFIHSAANKYGYLQAYALSKKQFLDWGRLAAEVKPIRFLNVRLEHLYGPYDNDTKFTSYIIRSCMERAPELLLTPGEQRRDFIYVNDAVAAYLTLLKQADRLNARFVEYQLGTGRSVPVREFVELVHELTSSDTELRFGAIPYRENEIMQSQADPASLQTLGWSWKFGIREGIRDILSKEFPPHPQSLPPDDERSDP